MIDGFKPNSGELVHLFNGTTISSVLVSISTRQSKLDLSILRVSLKSSTKNPDLNLSPVASLTCKDLVSSSSIVKLVTISKFVTLLSILPISLIVYLLLSIRDIFASFGLYKYAGRWIVAICIASSINKGSLGDNEETPLINENSPSFSFPGVRINLSILGKYQLYPKVESASGDTTKVDVAPSPLKSLLVKANGDLVVEVNSDTLGLKSSVSVALVPLPKVGISYVYLSLLYELAVNTSPVSLDGTV